MRQGSKADPSQRTTHHATSVIKMVHPNHNLEPQICRQVKLKQIMFFLIIKDVMGRYKCDKKGVDRFTGSQAVDVVRGERTTDSRTRKSWPRAEPKKW